MALFLIYFPRDQPEDDADESNSALEHKRPRQRDAAIAVAISMAHFLLVAFISLIWFAFSRNTIKVWADLLGVCSAGLACIQYIPQIYTTWKLQEVKSLSIPMMCIQTPGSYVFAASLAIRLGPSGWSAWGVYIITGILQGCLLVMAISFELRDRRRRKVEEQAPRGNEEVDDNGTSDPAVVDPDDDSDTQTASERSPLLGGTRPTSNGSMSNGNGRSPAQGHETIKKSKLSVVHNADEGTP
jgi:uncharacterized protein with PQ loop repeat